MSGGLASPAAFCYRGAMNWSDYPKLLEGRNVRLEPLTMAFHESITAALIPDPEGWYQTMFGLNTAGHFRNEIAESEAGFKARRIIPFAIRDNASTRIAGRCQFMKIDIENRHLEIGNTMIGPEFRRTHVNTETKFLMLSEAFEVMKMNRVSFRVDLANLKSRRAVERIGAIYGGELRAERILPDGRARDYAFYCILSEEWSTVKTKIQNLMV
ncbi:GNAT family protein [soil metagenome]